MIKFFRRIRYNHMETGKTGKYFKYAIGEIALVVIGILIALSINNWKEQRQTRSLELSIVQEIQQALVQDTIVISSNLKYLKNKKLECRELISHIENKLPYIAKLDTLMMQVYYHRGYKTFNISAFEILKENGFRIIENTTLRKQITKHYTSDMSDINGLFGRLEQINLIQGNNMYENFKVGNGLIKSYDYQKLLENPEIFGPFYHFETMNNAYINSLTDFKRKISILLEAIRLELNVRNVN